MKQLFSSSLKSLLKPLITGALTTTALAAQAHTGHGTHSLMEGLSHPFGLDHLLAMLAVGVWSVAALPANKAWQGPAAFMLALVLSAVAGAAGFTLPFIEHAVSLSVVLFGLMLVFAARQAPASAGLALVAAAASVHGLAHGAEAPAASFTAYALGFLVTSAALHVSGVALGLSVKRWLGERSGVALGGMGAALGAAGMYLATQI